MNKSSTGGGGRGSDAGEIIGKVINHGKKEFWTARGSYHYHHTLQAGENTLEAQLTRLVCKSVTDTNGKFSPDDMRDKYVKYMQTPGSHNDCYASTCHRMFFANLVKGSPPEKCPDNDNHNVDTIDGLILAVPVILSGWQSALPTVQKEAALCTGVTRDSTEVAQYVGRYASMLTDVVNGKPLAEVLKGDAARGFEDVIQGARRRTDPVVS
jgi:ADP-ribosylglycohydrolase